jgi:hypothetical protein
MALAIAARPPDFSIVLPARNEVANIAPMVAELRQVMAPLGRLRSSMSTMARMTAPLPHCVSRSQ